MRAARALALLWALPVAAGADVLVLRDGGRVETRGAWKEQGKLVVFQLADGTLASLRRETVDLEASARASAPAASVSPAMASRDTPAKRVFTESSVSKLRAVSTTPSPPEGAGSTADPDARTAEEADASIAGAPTGVPDLKVLEWRRRDSAELAITGALVNGGADQLLDVHLTVQLFGADGTLLLAAPATLDSSTLAPGQRTPFTATFPGILSYVGLRFVVDRESLARIASRRAKSEG